MTRRLFKSSTNKVLAGVCGGLGEYFDVDPVLIRLLYLMVTVFTGIAPGLLCYVIAVAIVPAHNDVVHHKPDVHVVHDSTQI